MLRPALLSGARQQTLVSLSGALLLLLSSQVAAQQIVTPKGSINGPTPFVGAYYFNWYNLEDQWNRYAQTRSPTLGRYDQSDPAVLAKHHEWAKKGGIDFFAMAWSGGGSELVKWERADEIDRRITSHLKMTDGTKVALMYNVRDFAQAGSHGKIDLAENNYCAIVSDHLLYAAQKHFPEDNYFKIGENPVIFLYTLRDFVNYVDCFKLALERVLLETGIVPYIIGDTVWWSPAADRFAWEDFKAINVSAVTAFNTYDAGQPQKMGLNFALENALLFHDMISPAWGKAIQVIPSITPGFDDRRLRGPARPTIERAHGAELVQQWKQVLWFPVCQTQLHSVVRRVHAGMFDLKGFAEKAKPEPGARARMVASGPALVAPPIIMINSFNEWHDGTEIEPSLEEGETILNILAQLKAEVVNEDMQCGKEKDKNFRAPKYLIPKMFKDDAEYTPADQVFIRGMSVVAWFFIMWIIWVFNGQIILHYTGRAPNKYKDDDLGGRHGKPGGIFEDFATSIVPTEAFVNSGSKYPKRVPTMMTLGAVAFTGVAAYALIYAFLSHSPVVKWFDDRATTWERRGHGNVRRAREIAHKLCPELVLNLHKSKFEEWVRKLAASQISAVEFRQEMCSDKGLHTREIEAMYLELLGRAPEESGLQHYEKAVEEGSMTLADVRLAIQNSPESTDWQNMRQARKTKIHSGKLFAKGIEDAMRIMRDATTKVQKDEDRAAMVGSIDVVQHRVQELMNQGKVQEAQSLLNEYKASSRGIKGPRRMEKEEAAHHDSLMDDWDAA